jgi:hypothetical protein
MSDTTRHNTQKVQLNDDEMGDLLTLSTAMRRQRGPLIRELIAAAYCDLQSALATPCRPAQVSASRTNREGPRHGHFASTRRRLVLPNARDALGAPEFPLRV